VQINIYARRVKTQKYCRGFLGTIRSWASPIATIKPPRPNNSYVPTYILPANDVRPRPNGELVLLI